VNHANDVRTQSLPRPIPERIKEAREARGYALDTFADALNVTRQAAAQYETGQIAPSSDVMSRIVGLTALPPAFFTTSHKRASDDIAPFWRGLKRMEEHHRRRIARRLQWAYDVAEFIERFIHLPIVRLPHIEYDPEPGGDEQIETAAMAVRDLWGLGRGPIHNLTALFEDNGILLVREEVECDDMDAVSCWQRGRPFILFSAEVRSGPRSKFNLAHELGHIILHAGVEMNSRNMDKIEKQANRFAGALLLPRETFAKEVLGTSIGYFKYLKERWGVAISAMVYRCKELGVLSKSQQAYLMRQMNYLRIKEVEPLDDQFPVGEPSVLAESLQMLINNGVQTKSQIEQAIPVNLTDVERLCGVPKGYLDTRIVQLTQKPRLINN
jgi:Zn-dependent peptidase ImmA (M78 family)/transcriptional regulator with XRE-family HTH domain